MKAILKLEFVDDADQRSEVVIRSNIACSDLHDAMKQSQIMADVYEELEKRGVERT